MTNPIVQRLVAGGMLLLGCVGLLAQPAARLAFEAASVKPHKGGTFALPQLLPGGRFTSAAPLYTVIATAYNLPFQGTSRLTGGPSWISSQDSVYDIEATPERGAIPPGLSPIVAADRARLMLQTLLADRFKLAIHRETKEMTVYELVVAKDGPKFPKADVEEKDCPERPTTGPADGNIVCHQFNGGRGRGLHGRAVDMSDLVRYVENWTDRPLLDKTGIKGLYHIETQGWLPMELGSSPPPPGTKQDGVDVADLPTLFTVFDRLGLKMESQKDRVDTYVIDHIEKPSEN